MGIESLIPIGASLLGSSMQSDAIDDASAAQAASTREGIAEQRRQFDLQREDTAPYRQAGANALAQLQAQMGRAVSPAEVMADPGYEFGRQQGQMGLDRKFAAAGGRVSGAAMKAASRYNTDYASTGYGAAYQRRQDALNRLASVAGIGQTATGASAAAGSNMANQIGNMLTAQGNASAGAQMARGSLWGDTANQLGAMYQRYRTPGIGDGYGSGWSGYGTGNANAFGDY